MQKQKSELTELTQISRTHSGKKMKELFTAKNDL